MNTFEFKEIIGDEKFDPNTIYDDSPFTQAQFYGIWQKNLNRTVKRLLVYKNEDVVAYLQIIKYPLPFGKNYLYIPYGPVVHPARLTQAGVDTVDNFIKSLKNELKKLAKENSAVFVRMDFTPLIENKILSRFFKKSPKCTYHSSYFQPRNEWVLDLTKNESELFNSQVKKTRYAIRTSEKREIKTEIITSNFKEYFDTFYNLMSETAKRNKFNIHQKEYFSGIFDSLENVENAYLSISKFDKEVLAISLIIPHGKTAHYVFGCSGDVEKNRNPAYSSQWSAILHAKELGLKKYSFGGVSAEGDSHKSWESLTSFKKNFNGEVMKHSDFYDLVINPFWYFLYVVRKCIKK